MPRSIILHAGMPKTGSSSIQASYSNSTAQNFEYLPWDTPNHSDLLALIFMSDEELLKYHGFAAVGLNSDALRKKRADALESLSLFLNNSRNSTVMISAEDLSTPKFSPILEDLRNYLLTYTDDIQLYVYVRPPSTFMASFFQQALKGNPQLKELFRVVLPNYRVPLEAFEKVFGRVNVHLVPFVKENFTNGNVVDDFESRIGFQKGSLGEENANSSLSSRATALIYVQRRFGLGYIYGHKRSQISYEKFVKSVEDIGETKLELHSELQQKVWDRKKDDIDWLKSRFGNDFVAKPTNTSGIRCEDDLINDAILSFGVVRAKVHNKIATLDPNNTHDLVKLLDALMVLNRIID